MFKDLLSECELLKKAHNLLRYKTIKIEAEHV